MSARASRPRLRVGDWLLDTTSYEIERNGRRDRLPRRLGRLLERLAGDPGRVVPHAVLLAEVWERPNVEAEVLARAIAELRRALGDDPRTPQYIETIPKSGYRLIAPVTALASDVPLDDPASAPELAAASAAGADRPRPWKGLLVGVAVIAATAAVAVWRHGAMPRQGARDPFARERPLTSSPGYELAPSLSADGTLVAYGEVLKLGEPPEIVIQALDGQGRRKLAEPPGYYAVRPAFSPDGRQLAFLRRAEGSCELHVRPVLAGESRRLADCSPEVPSSASWSPDGSLLAYTAPASAAHAPGLALYELASDSIRTLTTPPRDEGPDLDPRFARDGRTLAFTRGEDSDRRVLVTTLDTPHEVRDLGLEPSRVTGLAWTPDGRALIVGSDAPGYRVLVRIGYPSGTASIFGARGGQAPAFAANGDLAYELASYDANIWRLDLASAGATPVAVVRSTRYDGTPSIAPDGKRFAFVSTRDDHENVGVAAIDGSDEHRLPLEPGYRWVLPNWSPDGGALLLSRYEGARTAVYRHELASGRTTRLDALGDHAFSAEYLDDGSAIVYLRRDRPAAKSLWRISATLDGAPTPLAEGVAIDRFGTGAGVVVYSQPRRNGLVVLPLDGGAAHEVLPDLRAQARWNWCLVGRRIWYVVAAGDSGVLRRYDIDDASDVEIAPGVDPSAVSVALSVSHDATSVLFARVDQFSIDLMLAPRAAPP